MNRRKLAKGLTHKQVPAMTAAWRHAWRIGAPLNQLVTFRPMDGDRLSGNERCDLFAKLRNKLGSYARTQGFPATFVWSREAGADGGGEHMHVLIHVPDRLHRHFADIVWGWLPERSPGGEYMTTVDVRPADQHTKFTDHGKRYNAIGYICKQMTPNAWFKRGMHRVAGGPIFGKRGGVTVNLSTRVIAAWEPPRPPVKLPGAPLAWLAHRGEALDAPRARDHTRDEVVDGVD